MAFAEGSMNSLNSNLLIPARGANDIGLAVAHRLFFSGYAVIIHEDPEPITSPRKKSFTKAVYGGIGERPARIAEGVLTTMQRWDKGHAH